MADHINRQTKTYDLVYISVFAVIIAICSWISIPSAVPFTLQTMGVFVTLGLLGGKRGTIAVSIYILLGAIGIPVFSGFAGGIGVLIGKTGGYIVGFLFSALVMWGYEKLFGRKKLVLAISMITGLIICYAFGTLWFMFVYAKNTGAIGLWTVLGWCVFPFIIPDLLKIAMAMFLTNTLSRTILYK